MKEILQNNKNSYLEFVERGIKEIKRLQDLSDKEKNYLKYKSNKIVDLFIELEQKKFIRILSKQELAEFREDLSIYNNNLSCLSSLYLMFINIVLHTKKRSSSTEIILVDEDKNRHPVSMNQVAIITVLLILPFANLLDYYY